MGLYSLYGKYWLLDSEALPVQAHPATSPPPLPLPAAQSSRGVVLLPARDSPQRQKLDPQRVSQAEALPRGRFTGSVCAWSVCSIYFGICRA
jgi:hypothetical protein